MLGAMGLGTGHTHNEETAANVTADVYMSKIAMGTERLCSIQCQWDANLTAVLKVQASNLPNPTDGAAGTNEWDTLDVVFTVNPAGTAGTGSVSLDAVGYKWLRVFVDYTSGTGGKVRTYIVIKPNS